MRFKLIAGSHLLPSGETKNQGETFEADLPLDEMFGSNKFQRLSDAPVKKSSKKKSTAKDTDATGEFDYDPEEYGLNVRKQGTKYYVYDEDDSENALNDKPLKKSEVMDFVNSQCEE